MAILSACAVINVSAQQLRYPMAPHDSTTDTHFGVKVADPLRPLEDDKSPATEAWVRAENQLTRNYLDKMPQRPQLLKRLKEVCNYGRVYTPFKEHGKWYVYRNNGVQNQSVLYQMNELGGKETVFLDPNTLRQQTPIAQGPHRLG